ncbi:MAG: 30S ribosomal protein S18 [Planctomycetota bacterium]
MSAFSSFATTPPAKVVFKSSTGKSFCDYKNSEELRRYLTPNGKIQSRKKTGLTAGEQRLLAQAIKRARHMGLLPFTSATL